MRDVQLLKEKLARAVLTLKALPPDPRNKPQGYLTSWPEMIRTGKKRRYITSRSSALYTK